MAEELVESEASQQSYLFREAAEAAAVVARQYEGNRQINADLGARLRGLSPRFVVTCSRGSSSTAATYGKYLIEKYLGVPTMPCALSLNSIYASNVAMAGGLCIAVSQSGSSPDILSSVAHAKACGALTLALTNSVDSPLAQVADLVIPLHAGDEQSIAATKTHLAAVAAFAQLVAAWSGDTGLNAALPGLSEAMSKSWSSSWSGAVDALRGSSSMYVIGRGLGLGAAQEAALKLKECCGIHAEALSAAEVKHGPMALVNKGFSLLLFGQNDEALDSVLATAELARGCEANLLLAVPGRADTYGGGHFEPALEPILLTQSFYRLLNALAFARGYNPDTPMHLHKVTKTI